MPTVDNLSAPTHLLCVEVHLLLLHADQFLLDAGLLHLESVLLSSQTGLLSLHLQPYQTVTVNIAQLVLLLHASIYFARLFHTAHTQTLFQHLNADFYLFTFKNFVIPKMHDIIKYLVKKYNPRNKGRI